tara:strand:+ start:239 stop:1186 length:948 start_codon:yes stop_codon:yes gene_type:complete
MRNHFLRAGRVANLNPIVNTNLEVYYDFGNRNSWNRFYGDVGGTHYTINNLANSNNNAVFRTRSNYANSVYSFEDSSTSEIINFDLDGPSLFMDGSQWADVYDNCALVLPGTFSDTTDSTNFIYNAPTTTGTTNALNGVGTGAYTIEFWIKWYYHAFASFTGPAFYFDTTDGDKWTSFNFLGGGYPASFSFFFRSIMVDPSPYAVWQDLMEAPGLPATTNNWTDWVHVVYSRENTSDVVKLYLNNTLQIMPSSFVDSRSINNLRYGRLTYIHQSVPANFAAGNTRFGPIRIYKNKGLTAAEVEQNWNSEKARFGH